MSVTLTLLSLVTLVQSAIDYCDIHASNTLCLYQTNAFGPSCDQVTEFRLSHEDKHLILEHHNNLRRSVASGMEHRGLDGPQPPAANMRQMVWDDELALVAQTHAQQCLMRHATNSDSASGQVRSASRTVNWKAMVDIWYGELASMNISFIRRFPRNEARIGHYSQMVWSATFALGCGAVGLYDERPGGVGRWHKWLLVCNYGPTGNFIDQPVYKIGPAVSECPRGTSPWRGLCASQVPLPPAMI